MILNILEKILPVMIVVILIISGAAIAKGLVYHCPIHGEVSYKDLVTIGRGDYTGVFCVWCIVDYAAENLPELYRVEK